jgi:DNA-directed RNA polymerase III subunit RPC1
MKETFVDKDIPKRIKHIQFGVLSPQEIWQYAEIEICNKDMYESSGGVRKPAKHGCLDPHLVIII